MKMTHPSMRPLLGRLTLSVAGLTLALSFTGVPALAQQDSARTNRQAGSANAPQDETQTQSLPSAKEIFQKYVQATGGEEAYRNLKSQHATGTLALPAMGMSGKIELFQQSPDKMLALIDLPGMGQAQEGYNGEVAWSVDPNMGPRLKDGEELNAAKREAATDIYIDPDKYYQSMEVKGVEDVDGQRAYRVVLTPKEGGKPSESFFAVDSGLVVKSIATQQGPMGEMQAQSMMQDYRKTADGAFTLPHKMTISASGQEFVITLEKIESNVELPADRFDPPAEVKQLMDKKTPAPTTMPGGSMGGGM